MPRRISSEVDMNILADIGLGMRNIDIAERYGVSPSYVSKLKRGKKKIDIHIPKPEVHRDLDFSSYASDLDAISDAIGKSKIFTEEDTVENYIKDKARYHITHAKVYIEILKKYKGE